MRTNQHISLIAAPLALSIWALVTANAAAQDNNAAAPAIFTPSSPDTPSAVLLVGAPFNMPLEDATYLGVVAQPVDAVVSSQLKLAPGMGLAVAHVDGPAKEAGVELNDILLKLDDQKLINPSQLAVLVRSCNTGDAVTLSIIRDSQPMDVKVTLGTAKLPPLQFQTGMHFFGAPNIDFAEIQAHALEAQERALSRTGEALEAQERALSKMQRKEVFIGAPAQQTQIARHRTDDMEYTITVTPGQPARLTIIGGLDGVLYEGPIPPAGKWELLPGEPEVTQHVMNKLVNLLGLEVEE